MFIPKAFTKKNPRYLVSFSPVIIVCSKSTTRKLLKIVNPTELKIYEIEM